MFGVCRWMDSEVRGGRDVRNAIRGVRLARSEAVQVREREVRFWR